MITLAPHLAEMVCAVGGCGQLVGVVEYTDFPAEAAAKPKIGNAFAADPERVLALRPDLVLAWDGGNPPAMTERLRSLGVPVRSLAVRSLDDVAARLLDIGGLLGREDQACAVAQQYRDRLAALRTRYAGRPRLRVLYQIEVEPLFTINRTSPISEAIELCGGVNVFGGLPQLSAPVNKEAVLAADPDVVVFSRQDYVEQIRAFWARWPQAKAQARGHLYTVDANLLERQSPRLLDGVEQLCEVLEQARK
ncbi:MAG TPA: cobalamin-binding protein [Solimonas sp.]|nr:cobalamin-binding protein [Solimonas sp.]